MAATLAAPRGLFHSFDVCGTMRLVLPASDPANARMVIAPTPLTSLAQQGSDQVLDVVSQSPEQTRRLGQRLGELARPGDVYLLTGDLGSGKTCLTQGVARGLGVSAPVTSPTFTLINEYTRRATGARLPLFHADLYRLDRPEAEAVDLGLEEYLDGPGVCIIEWAERAPSLWPAERLVIRLRTVSETKRTLVFAPEGERYVALIRALRRAAFGV